MKKTVLLDMDDTIADFQGSPVFGGRPVDSVNVSKMYEPGFFLSLQPVPGALQFVRKIIKLGYDVYIVTQPVAESPHSYSEKVQWIGKWFPELVTKIIMTQEKGMIRGDYLIDDRADKWKDKFEANGGKFIHFKYHRGGDQWNFDEWGQMATNLEFRKELEEP